IPVIDRTRETGIISPTDLPILVLINPGVPLRATLIQFALLVCVDTKESVVELQADKKPGASARVFAITEGQAANTSGTITGTLFIYGHAVFVTTSTSGQADKKPATMTGNRTMAEILCAPTEGCAEAIIVPLILADQFELKHSLINMMTSEQFFGLEKDNPHDHVRWGQPASGLKKNLHVQSPLGMI
nr:reverse transcriptase domain-containing protein [Tanacetum cinerariifolium]